MRLIINNPNNCYISVLWNGTLCNDIQKVEDMNCYNIDARSNETGELCIICDEFPINEPVSETSFHQLRRFFSYGFEYPYLKKELSVTPSKNASITMKYSEEHVGNKYLDYTYPVCTVTDVRHALISKNADYRFANKKEIVRFAIISTLKALILALLLLIPLCYWAFTIINCDPNEAVSNPSLLRIHLYISIPILIVFILGVLVIDFYYLKKFCREMYKMQN